MKFLKNHIMEHSRAWISGLLIAGIILHSSLLYSLAMLLWLAVLLDLIIKNKGISRTMQIVYGILAVIPVGYLLFTLWVLIFH